MGIKGLLQHLAGADCFDEPLLFRAVERHGLRPAWEEALRRNLALAHRPLECEALPFDGLARDVTLIREAVEELLTVDVEVARRGPLGARPLTRVVLDDGDGCDAEQCGDRDGQQAPREPLPCNPCSRRFCANCGACSNIGRFWICLVGDRLGGCGHVGSLPSLGAGCEGPSRRPQTSCSWLQGGCRASPHPARFVVAPKLVAHACWTVRACSPPCVSPAGMQTLKPGPG